MATSPAQMANEISSLRSDLIFFRRSTKFRDDPVGLMVELNGRVTQLMDLARDLPTPVRDKVRLSMEELRRWLSVESFEASYDRARTNEFAVAVRNGIAKTGEFFKDQLEQLSLDLAVWLPQQPMLEPPPTSGGDHGAGEHGESRTRKRGRRKGSTTSDSAKDLQMFNEWSECKVQGISRKDFAAEKHISLKALVRTLGRVYRRQKNMPN